MTILGTLFSDTSHTESTPSNPSLRVKSALISSSQTYPRAHLNRRVALQIQAELELAYGGRWSVVVLDADPSWAWIVWNINHMWARVVTDADYGRDILVWDV